MLPSLLLVLLLAAPAHLTPSTSQELQVRGQRAPRDTNKDSIKVVITEGCATQGDSADVSQGGKEIDLAPGSPLVLTHKIKLVPSGSGSGSGSDSCGCEADFAALRERLERLEREVSALREKCGGAEGGCCTSKESKGAGCSIKPDVNDCPNECSDQGRCVDGKCVCFPGFSGADCSESNCPGNCNDKGRCVNGQCVCDPGFAGPDCSQKGCPDDCNDRGRCVNGKCVCNSGFTGPSCSEESCPGNCNNRGRCVNGQCVCKAGFIGPDCSKRGCPDNCNNRGRCVNGKCVCDSGWTGKDCSESACPGNCNNRGQCVNGECVCNEGFGGPDCLEITCPNDCYDRGKCVNGQCICDDGFTGEDCSETACPGNCNNRGRCVNGQCICDDGFTGEDCSENSCPGNCNNRGRCINGQCVCDDGFTGDDCSENSCPGNCNNRGRCINGQCVCDDGFTGEDCSEDACPGNCNNRGRCVNGQCVCDDRFTGEDCSEKACPNNCSNRGKCVNGKCVCDVGFAGPDCAAKGCPNNCNNKGRCVKGRCVCRRGFTGPDCSQCEEGMTGPNCDTAMSGVSQLSTRDVTETSVTLLWTPPPVQYDTYYITFSSEKESDQKISVQVEGSLTSFTQTGLAAGQEYTASITGEIDGRRGAESSAQFMTLISGPTNLQVVKTSTTSAVVQWEQSQGEIDRYRLTVTPSDGAGRSQEMTVPSGQDSAHIQQLEAGRLYDITLVAEKGTSRSEPAATQVTPGTLRMVTTAALTMQGPVTPGQGAGNTDREFDPAPQVQRGGGEDGSKADGVVDGLNKDSSATVIARTKPLVVNGKKKADGTRPKLAGKPTFPKKANVTGTLRFRPVPAAKKPGHGPLKKPIVKAPTEPKKSKAGVHTIGNRPTALTVRDPSVEASSAEREEARNPAIVSGTDSETNRQSSSEEPTAGSKGQSDVDTADRGNETAPVSSEPIGTSQSQEKKCLNKIKVTHIRLPLKDRGSGCRSDGTVLEGKTPDSHQDFPETGLDYSRDPLHKLLTDTFDNLNITTFSVHLSNPSDLSVDADSVRLQILRGPTPLQSLPSSSSSSSQSRSHSSAAPSSSSSSGSAVSSSSQEYTVSSTPSPSPSSVSPSGSNGGNELDTGDGKSTTDVTIPEDRKLPPSGKGGVPLFRRPSGYVRRPRPNFGSFQNRTHPNLKAPHRSSSHSNMPTSKDTPTSEFLSPPFSSTSEESSSVEASKPVKDTTVYKDGTITPASSGVEQSEKNMPTERGRIPVRRIPPKGGYIRNPNFALLRNRTRPNVRLLPPPSRPLNPASDTSKTQESSTGLTAKGTRKEQESSTGLSTSEIRKEQGSSTELPASATRKEEEYSTGLPSSDTGKEQESSTRLPASHLRNEQESSTEMPALEIRKEQESSTELPALETRKEEEYSTGLPLSETRKEQESSSGLPASEMRKKEEFPTGLSSSEKRKEPLTSTELPPSETRKEQESFTELPATSSSPVSKESDPAENAGPIREETEDRVGASMPKQFNQTLRGSDAPSSHRPSTKLYFRRPKLYGGHLQNKTRINLRPPLNPQRGPFRKPVPTRRINGGSGITAGSPASQLEKIGTPEIPDPRSEEQETPIPTQGVHVSQTGEQDDTGVIPRAQTDGSDSTVRLWTNELAGRDSAPVQATGSEETDQRTPDSISGQKERLDSAENTGSSIRGRPTLKQKHGPPRRFPLPKRLPPKKGTQRGDETNTNDAAQRLLDSKTDQTRGAESKPVTGSDVSSSGVTREPLDYVGVTNQTQDGLTSTEDSVNRGDSAPVQTTKSDHEDTRTPDSNSDTRAERFNTGVNTGSTIRGRPTLKQTSDSRHGAPRRVPPPRRQPPIKGIQRGQETKTKDPANRLLDSETDQTRSAESKPATGSDISSSGVTREPLDHVGVTNHTRDGFTLTWDSPEGKYKNFVVTRKEVRKDNKPKPKQRKEQEEGHTEEEEGNLRPIKESDDENRVPESTVTQVSRIQSSTTAKPDTGSDEIYKKLLPGSARSYQFENLPPKTEYTVTLLGKGPGLLSKLHKLVISTGPEPPTNIIFSKVTENSLTVSWTKPKSPISGFKVTYTHKEEGEPVSVSVDADDSTLGLSKLSPGSSYEVSVISILGLDESDPVKDFVATLPDPPTDLRAVNVTDSGALLLWRPALAAVDKYAIVYGAGTDSELRVSVSGNAAEQQLSGLQGSTTYTVTITSQLGGLESSPATTTFTTTGGSGGDGPRDLQANNVTPRTALLSWKPPLNPVGNYRLTYQTEGGEVKEVIVDASVTEYNLSRLHPGSMYTVQLQAEGGGRYTAAISTDFTTGTLRFPFPTDCSQELLNGIKTSGEAEIFPQGKLGTSVMVYCDMETDGGGWTVFQRRKDGSVDFFRSWKDYTKGFGDLSGEFWLGLDSLHNLTAMTRMSLRVDLQDKDESVFAKYSTFEVAKRNYRLTVGGYSGTAGDSFSYHNNRVFSTRDRDPAPFITRCAMSYRGGWWYKNCHEANLNGLYGIDVKHQGVIWTTWKGKEHSIPFTEMKMRPAAFSPPTRG